MSRIAPLLVLALATACKTAPVTTTEPAAGSFHTLKPGETVWDVARESGLPVDEIVEVNGLASADDVAAGQVLFLPAGALVVDDAAPPERVPPPPPPAGNAILAWPIDGVVLRDFSTNAKSPFDGILIAAPAGTPVLAAKDGTVLFAGDQGTAYGTIVVVDHGEDLVTVYGLLGAAKVKKGEKVQRGDVVGVVGDNPQKESPRLHFQVRRGRTVVDPAPLLPSE